jgi:Calx-beta domain/Beta-agarase/YXIM esterase-like, galactose-binding domain-like
MSFLSRWRFWPRPCRQRYLSRSRPIVEELERRDVPSTLPLLLDLGTNRSPVADGYTQVPLEVYSPETGFGWETLDQMYAKDSRGDDPLTRDFHFGRSSNTFLVDLPPGTYDITAILGDTWHEQEKLDFFLEGQLLASDVATAPGEFIRLPFHVDVTDGQLDLTIIDRGGKTHYFGLNGLEIVPASPPTISIDDVTVAEGNGPTTATFNVQLSRPSQQTVTVDYATTSAAALLADGDYTPTAGTLSFAPGVTTQTITVAINGDDRFEPDESFLVNLTNAINADLARSQATGVIVNDDANPNGIVIDDAWLNARGKGSFILDQPGATYVLATDVRTPATAFVVGAAGVTLDLNGHTITYGDALPPVVLNGGFEQGSGRDVPGWDLSGAPTAALASNTSLLFGNQVLRLSSYSSAQRVISDPISIPLAGRSYTATITPANPDSHSTLTLSVIDSVTGQVLGTATSGSAARGFSPVVTFTPTTTNPVRLQVDVAPLAGTDTLDLDQATLTVAGDYGILASPAYSGDILGWNALTPAAQSASRQAADFTVTNGFILQGQGDGYASSPLFFRSLPGLTVDHVETHATGMDTQSLEATYAKVRVNVLNSTFREDIDNISNRIQSFATLKLNNISAPILVENNHLLGSPQIGIMLARNDPQYTVKILGNEFVQNTVVTNGYAIILSAVQNFEIAGNTVHSISGKGFNLDGYTDTLLGHGTIHDNNVDVQERANREYPHGLESVGLRLRNTVDQKGPQRDIAIYNNVFTARTGPGLVEQAYGARISYANINGAMDDAGISLENNTFQAIAETTDPTYHAKALVLDSIDAGVGLRIANNVLESNDIALALTDSGGGVSDVDLVSNTLRLSSEGPARPFTGILAGYYNREIHDVRIFDTRLENGATGNIVFAGTGVKDLSVGWLLDVTVQDSAGNPAAGASVSVRDRDGTVIYSGTSGSDGTITGIPVVTTVYRQTTTNPSQVTEDLRGPFEVLATDGTLSTTQDIDLASSMGLILTPG